jgi:hypothetical protein
MSETKRIDWNDPESVVRAAVSGVYIGRDTGWIWAEGNIRYMLGETWVEARKHPSVAALDEAHRKVMEKWPDARSIFHPPPLDNAWEVVVGHVLFGKPKFLQFETEAAAWIDAASKLEGPSVQGKDLAPQLCTPSARDWVEDSSHENGNYQCKCVSCGLYFVGHKRRVQCKLCASVPAPCEEEGAGVTKSVQVESWTPEKALDRLDEIHKEVQTKFHDKWDWFDACFAVNILREALSAAPVVEEAPRVVTWKVQELAPHGWWNCGGEWSEAKAHAFYAEYSRRYPVNTFRIIKITTIEEVIEVRTKESADGR